MSRCKTCGDFPLFPESHKCPPIWLCQLKGDSADEWEEVYARDAEAAAEKFAEKWDIESEYSMLRGFSDYIVSVKPSDAEPDGVARQFAITAEAVPTYYGRELE